MQRSDDFDYLISVLVERYPNLAGEIKGIAAPQWGLAHDVSVSILLRLVKLQDAEAARLLEILGLNP